MICKRSLTESIMRVGNTALGTWYLLTFFSKGQVSQFETANRKQSEEISMYVFEVRANCNCPKMGSNFLITYALSVILFLRKT